MKNIFCSQCGNVTEQTGIVDQNGELLFTCSVCSHFIKFPPVTSKEELEALIADEETINKPLATERAQAAEQAQILSDLLS